MGDGVEFLDELNLLSIFILSVIRQMVKTGKSLTTPQMAQPIYFFFDTIRNKSLTLNSSQSE